MTAFDTFCSYLQGWDEKNASLRVGDLARYIDT